MENRIKEVLIEKGITQKELAKRVGMTEVGICKAINGSAKQSTIDKIADAIDVDSWELKNPPQRNVVCEGELHVADIHLPCYVLDDGERIISSRQMVLALRMVDDDKQQNMSGTRMARYLNQESLKPFIEKHLRDGNVETITCYKNGAKINGYLATDLVDICEMFLDARAHIKLSPRQKIIATQCEILVRAFAKVGIIALVDEATGYHETVPQYASLLAYANRAVPRPRTIYRHSIDKQTAPTDFPDEYPGQRVTPDVPLAEPPLWLF